MAEELKSEMRKLENLIGCQEIDITSKNSTEELVGALKSKYKKDLQNSIHLHRLEFYHDLIENARQKKKKSAEVEDNFLLEDDEDAKGDAKKEIEEKPNVEEEEEELQRPDEVVSVPPEDIDEYKNLMTLSKIYYVLEHPASEGLTWKRRTSKKRHISKFSDKDLIEWRVAQNFRLKALEEWALSRSEARKLAAESPYDFDDLLDDEESRELEDMFNIMGPQKQKKRDVGVLEKVLHTKRPFKLKDEGMKDWTESYSDDSDYSGAEQGFYDILDIEDEPEIKVGEYKESSDEPSVEEEESVPEIFSSYEDIHKYKRPIFEAMKETDDMTEWYDLCHEAIGEGREMSSGIINSPPIITVAGPEDRIESMLEVEKMSGTLSPLATIYEEDEKGYEISAHTEDTIRQQSTKSDIVLTVEKSKSELQAKERSSDHKVTEPESQVFISEDRERAVEEEIKSLARSSASDIVATKPSKEAELSEETDYDLDSVLRKESSTSKSKIARKGKETSSTVSHESVAKDKIKSLISTAKDSVAELVKEETANASEETELTTEEITDSDSALRMKSASKSKIYKNEEKDGKEITTGGISIEDHESDLKGEIQTLISEAKISAGNLTKDCSSSLESVSKSGIDKNESKEGKETTSGDIVLRSEFSSKREIDNDNKAENNVKVTASNDNVNEQHESAVKSEIQRLISEAKSSTKDIAEKSSMSLEETRPLREQNDSLDSILRIESSSKREIGKNNKVKNNAKVVTSNDNVNEQHESEVKSEIQRLISEAKSSTKNLAKKSSKPLEETESSREQKKRTSKSKIDETEEDIN